jgi:hypothetical protein
LDEQRRTITANRYRKMCLRVKLILLLLVAISCDRDDSEGKETNGYITCNNILPCGNAGNGAYCTFGYKWGAGNPFSNPGEDKPGPSVGPVEITYTFIDGGYEFNTHSQQKLISKSFGEIAACAKDTIRTALSRWEMAAAITFIEKDNDPTSDIKIVLGSITQGGVAFPAFPEKPCSDLAGQVAINFSIGNNCQRMYTIAIHEIGHALGLGHVQSDNVMNPNKVFTDLQPGDIIGIRSIYGNK